MPINTISNLDALLNELSPELNEGEFVFCWVQANADISTLNIIASCQEKEGLSLMLNKNIADSHGLSYSSTMAWITLNVYSDLAAVGLTAAVSSLLANNNIACNVIAAFHHDHLLVPSKDATKAMELLNSLKPQ